MPRDQNCCQWVTLREALSVFAAPDTIHQSAAHIRPLHWYVSCRLVLEGGLMPEDITPRPPFVARRRSGVWHLLYDEQEGRSGERNVLGGLKTKQVDVTVCKDGIGPVIAVSMKGTLRALRNLTNRMEEAVGDCTNLHIAYPALVYGFLQVVRANRESLDTSPNDVAICADGTVSESIARYHEVLERLAGRDDVRDVATKYEAVALALVIPDEPQVGMMFEGFPVDASPLKLSGFFARLYQQYDQRFVFAAPALEAQTRRVEWRLSSEIAEDPRLDDFEPRSVD